MVYTGAATPLMNIQLAVQGGGAKIILLMAALEGIERMRDQQLAITRVAGTSAGAIAGCLFAAHIPMSLAKERFVATFGSSLNTHFPVPSYWGCYLKFRKHRSLWDSAPLRKFLVDLFGGHGFRTFGDIRRKTNTEMIVVASNLGTSQKVNYQGDAQEIVPALLDSCAIPYCFRVWNTSENPVIVDGGICENLPSEELEQGEVKYGRVFAISFPHPSAKSPTNFQEFTKALLNTAIDHSVSRVKLRLGEDRVFCIDTKSQIGTFDFDVALKAAQSDTYERVREKSEEFFRSLIIPKRTQAVRGDPWKDQNISMMEKLNVVYNRQHLGAKLSYVHCRCVVQVNCLVQDPKSKWFETGDLVRYSVVHKTLATPIFCQRFSLLQKEDPILLNKMEFTVLDSENHPMETTSLPVRDPEFPDKRALLLFYLPQLPANSGPYMVEFTDEVRNFMNGLRERRKDELLINPGRAEGLIGRVDLVLHIPKEFEEARMINKPGEDFGQAMEFGELARDYPSPLGFRTIGWTTKNIAPGRIAVDVVV